MSRPVATAVALAVVLAFGTAAAVGGLAVAGGGSPGAAGPASGPGSVPADGADGAPADSDDGVPAADPGDDGPGTNLSLFVAGERSALSGELEAAVYGGRLALADSDRERARVVDRKLSATAALLDDVERRRVTLRRARANGSLSDARFRVRAARLAGTLTGVRRVLDRSATAAESLPADERRRYDLRARIDRQRSRVEELLSGELAAAARRARGGERASRAAPLDYAAVRAAFEGGETAMPGTLRPVFGAERITLKVDRANGSTAVFGLWTSDGRVVRISRRPPANPTLVVSTDYATVGEIRRAEDAWAATERAVADGRIRYRGVGVLNTLKYGTVTVGLALYDGAAWVVGGIAAAAGGVADFVGGVVDGVV